MVIRICGFKLIFTSKNLKRLWCSCSLQNLLQSIMLLVFIFNLLLKLETMLTVTVVTLLIKNWIKDKMQIINLWIYFGLSSIKWQRPPHITQIILPDIKINFVENLKFLLCLQSVFCVCVIWCFLYFCLFQMTWFFISNLISNDREVNTLKNCNRMALFNWKNIKKLKSINKLVISIVVEKFNEMPQIWN